MTLGWVIAVAVIIWFIIALLVMIQSDKVYTGSTEPSLFRQACAFALGFAGAGIFLLFHYPIASGVLFAIAAFVVLRGWLDLRKSEKDLARIHAAHTTREHE